MSTRLVVPLLALLLLAAPGCFKSSTFQASSESSSNSSYSSSGSSSRSSSPESAYRREVRQATHDWVLKGGDVDALQRDVSRIAKEHGITDWESNRSTFEAMGAGIKRTGVSGERFERLKTQLAGVNAQAVQWIQQGYDSESAP